MSRDSEGDLHQQLTQATIRAMRTLVVVAALLACGCKDEQKEAREVVAKAKDRTVEVIDTAGEAVAKAIVLGKGAKAELDKVYRTQHDYALAVDELGSQDAEQHAARLDAMPSIEVRGVRVGYEEDSELSLRGTTYSKHFRASWKRGDKIVRVSFYTKETLDLVAFAQLLQKLIPAVETVLT
jgi:hypothetical protein